MTMFKTMKTPAVLTIFCLFFYQAVNPAASFAFADISSSNSSSSLLHSSISSEKAPHSLILDITIVNQNRLVAVGERGHVISSANGTHWQQLEIPVQTTLTKVSFVNDSVGWAVGHNETIIHTQDGGKTWVVQHYVSGKQSPLFDVAFKDALNGVVIGANGKMFRTQNGGEDWLEEFHLELLSEQDQEYLNALKLKDEEAYRESKAQILPHFNRIFKDGRTLYLVGDSGLVAKSNDFGVNWEKLPRVYQGALLDIIRTQQGNLLVVASRGNVFRSLNNGKSWQQVETPTTSALNTVLLTEDKQLIVLGNKGQLLISNDDGQNFTLKEQSVTSDIIAAVLFKGSLYGATNQGVIPLKLTHKGLFE